jgi:hypothetical protein
MCCCGRRRPLCRATTFYFSSGMPVFQPNISVQAGFKVCWNVRVFDDLLLFKKHVIIISAQSESKNHKFSCWPSEWRRERAR